MHYLKKIFLQGMYVVTFICAGLTNGAQASEDFGAFYEDYPVQTISVPHPVGAWGLISCAPPYENVFGHIPFFSNPRRNILMDTPFDLSHVIGNITGSAINAYVIKGPENYTVSISIHYKEFSTNYSRLQNHDLLLLKAEDGSELPLKLGSDVSAIQTASKFEEALKELLGLSLGRAPATFQSSSTPIGPDNNDVLAIKALTHPIIGPPDIGAYYLWSVAGSNEITLSYYQFFWKASVNKDGRQTIRFGNNIYINLGENYLRTQDIEPIEFWIAESTHSSRHSVWGIEEKFTSSTSPAA